MNSFRLFTGEAVSAGHPDKLCDGISAAVTDAQIKQDPTACIGCETKATRKRISVDCEIKSSAPLKKRQIKQIVKRKLKEIGYNGRRNWGALFQGIKDSVFGRKVKIQVDINSQSPEIRAGVIGANGQVQGAGDQGIMFGHARLNDPEWPTEHMPETIWFCNRIMEKYDELRKTDPAYALFGPDAKCQLTLRYFPSGKIARAESIVFSAFHHPSLKRNQYEDLIKKLVMRVIPTLWNTGETVWHINPAGDWCSKCGPAADIGLTGRKIIVDAYGGHCPHGGGAFSGKDPSKVDVTGAYAARYIAKNLIEAGYARACTVQISYAIGVAEPQSVHIDFHDTETNLVNIKWGGVGGLEAELMKGPGSKIMDLTPAGIIRCLDLQRPIYEACSAYGHFGRKAADGNFPWEKTDLVSVLA